ncbi:MAG: hypothetical protein Q7T55_09720, partial [Solirubrobacteraceae bacterium]|nr:hypothetical protein [Solirubrobacteraceae bacterium]
MPTRVKLALLGAVLSLGALGLPWMGSRLDALPDLMGYQDSVLWVGLRVVAALATVVLSLQLVKVPELRETQRVVFGASAVLFVLRPITLIVTNPSSSDLSSGSMKVEQVFSPSWGILASFLAAGLMLAAAVMTHRSDDIREQAERDAARAALLADPELAAFAGPAPAPLVVADAPAPTP